MIIYTIYDYPKKITENIYFHEDMKNSRLIPAGRLSKKRDSNSLKIMRLLYTSQACLWKVEKSVPW